MGGLAGYIEDTFFSGDDIVSWDGELGIDVYKQSVALAEWHAAETSGILDKVILYAVDNVDRPADLISFCNKLKEVKDNE